MFSQFFSYFKNVFVNACFTLVCTTVQCTYHTTRICLVVPTVDCARGKHVVLQLVRLDSGNVTRAFGTGYLCLYCI
jgi:hypothetical protein